MIKKIICIILILLVLLSACKQSTPPEKTEIKIGVLVYQMEDPFMAKFPDYMNEYVKELEKSGDIRITLQLFDAKGSQKIQDEQLNKLFEFEYDILCLNVVDRTSAAWIIDQAKSENIPIVFFNREPVTEDMQRWDRIYYVGSMPNEAGIIQGEIVTEAYKKSPEKFDKNGDGKLQYVILEGEPGHQDSLVRTEYAITSLMNSGTEIERLASHIADFQRAPAEAAMAQWIDKYGNKIEMVICNNDNMALGAIDAYTEKEIPIEKFPIIVGVDGIPPGLEAVKNGQMLGTVLNDWSGQAKAIIDISIALAKKSETNYVHKNLNGHYILLNHEKITKENVDLYLEEIA